MRNHIKTLLAATAISGVAVVPAAAQGAAGQNQGQGAQQQMAQQSELPTCRELRQEIRAELQSGGQFSPQEIQQAEQGLRRSAELEGEGDALACRTEVEAVIVALGLDTNDIEDRAMQTAQAGMSRQRLELQTDAQGQQTAQVGGGRIVVDQPAPDVDVRQRQPQVDVNQPRPEVTVRQPQPEVIVRQQQPQISVRQPAPVVTVTQARPEITVRIPEPIVEITQPEAGVNVNVPEPDVQVSQAQPRVFIERPEPRIVYQESRPEVQVEGAEAQVDVERPENLQADVNIEQAEPEVRVTEAGEPQVNVQQADPEVRVRDPQEPQINIEQEQAEVRFQTPEERQQAQQSQQARQTRQSQQGDGQIAIELQDRQSGTSGQQQARSAGQQQATQAQRSVMNHPFYRQRVGSLLNEPVYGAEGNQVGELEDFAIRGDQVYAVVGFGGFLGIGDEEVAIPLTSVSQANGRLVVQGYTEAELEAMPEWNESDYRLISQRRTIAEVYENR